MFEPTLHFSPVGLFIYTLLILLIGKGVRKLYMDEKLLTAKEVAGLLKINTLTVYDYIKEGRLKAYRLGSRYRIGNKQLQKFLRDCAKEVGR